MITLPINTNNLIVTQANRLVEARYFLSVGEQRLILLMISLIHPNDEDFKDYEIKVSDLYNLLEIKGNDNYSKIKGITKSLLSRVLEIKEPGRLLQVSWLSSSEYLEKEGIVKLSFDPKLKPYLLQLKSHFTKLNLFIATHFRSAYTVRIYMLLKEYKYIGYFDIYYKELRLILGVKKEEYSEYRDFKKRVLDQAQNELLEKNEFGNYKSDISFEIEIIERVARKINKLRFVIKVHREEKEPLTIEQKPLIQEQTQTQEVNNQSIALDLDKEKEEVYKKLIALSVNRKTALVLCKTHLLDRLVNNIRYAQREIEQGKDIANIAGFIVKAISEDFYNQTRLKIEDEKNIKQEKKSKEEEEQKRQEELNRKRVILEKEASKQIRSYYLNNLTEQQKEELFIKLKNKYAGNQVIYEMIKDINSRMIAYDINQLIPDFEEKKRRYIEDNLKTK